MVVRHNWSFNILRHPWTEARRTLRKKTQLHCGMGRMSNQDLSYFTDDLKEEEG
jgi:hypothetical protein